LSHLEAACAAEGRDPATLAVTVGVGVDYGPTAGRAETQTGPATALTGSAEEVAAGLHGYARVGVAHVICALDPATPEALAHLGAALTIYRGLSGA